MAATPSSSRVHTSPLRDLSSPVRRSPNQSPIRGPSTDLEKEKPDLMKQKVIDSIERLQPFSQNYLARRVIERLKDIIANHPSENDGFTVYEEEAYEKIAPLVDEIISGHPLEPQPMTLDKIKFVLSRLNLYFSINAVEAQKYLSEADDKKLLLHRPSGDSAYLTVSYIHNKRIKHHRFLTSKLCQLSTLFEVAKNIQMEVNKRCLMESIIEHDAFHGTLTRIQAECRLTSTYSWLLRYSESQKKYVLTIQKTEKYEHIIIETSSSRTFEKILADNLAANDVSEANKMTLKYYEDYHGFFCSYKAMPDPSR